MPWIVCRIAFARFREQAEASAQYQTGERVVSEALQTREQGSPELQSEQRRQRRQFGLRLFRRLVVYHVILIAGLLLAASTIPGFVQQLPIGGVSTLVEGGDVTVENVSRTVPLSESVPAADFGETASAFDRLGYARQLTIILIGTWLLMLPIAWVHKGIHRVSSHDRSLDETVLILPGIVAAIVLVVQHSLALAFSLAGIVAGVQFRRALQDTFDTLFILVAIGTGIAAGVRALEIAAVLTVFFTYSTLYVHYFGDGLESEYVARKKEEKQNRKQADKSQVADADDD